MKTLIQAYIYDVTDLTISTIELFVCEHEAETRRDLKTRIGAAFRAWYMKTTEGKDYVDDEGNNWGDSLEIPDGFLRRQGIDGIYSLLRDGKFIDQTLIDEVMVVNHDEFLFDIGIADDEADGKIPTAQ